MNALRVSNVILLRPAAKAVIPPRRRATDKPVLRAVWRVAADTGRLECTWADASASDLPYSRAA